MRAKQGLFLLLGWAWLIPGIAAVMKGLIHCAVSAWLGWQLPYVVFYFDKNCDVRSCSIGRLPNIQIALYGIFILLVWGNSYGK